MNYRVPDFEMDDDCLIPTSSSYHPRQKNMPDDEIMELLWHNGQVIAQSQNQRTFKKSPPTSTPPLQQLPTQPQHPPPENDSPAHVFMQEDEMAAWLHYPLDDPPFDRELYADLLIPPPAPAPAPSSLSAPIGSVAAAPAVRTAVTPAPVPTTQQQRQQLPRPPLASTRNFPHFSILKGSSSSTRILGPSGASSSQNNEEIKESATVVESNETPAARPDSRVSHMGKKTLEISGRNLGYKSIRGTVVAGTSSVGGGGCSMSRELETCDLTTSSSPGASGASASLTAEPVTRPAPPEDRKRKGAEPSDPGTECFSEDAEIESAEAKKRCRVPTAAKRSRAAEVHNLSERRRRDRINEKMKALQELIPRCSKSDKASMLDEAIEYLKSLQLQVQMMSMGCGMVPMMFPGVQQYMPHMGMGMGMGMGMSMETGMNRPMMPFPPVLPASALPTPTAAPHLGPRFPLPPAFPMPRVPAPDPSRIQASNHADSILSSLGLRGPNLPVVQDLADPYQQYLGIQQMQVQLPQNQHTARPSTSKPGASKDSEDKDNHQCG